MFYLISAIAFSTGILISFKLFPRFKINIIQAITTNYIVATLFGQVSAGFFSPLSITQYEWFPYSLIVGCSLILVFFVFALSTQKAGVSITAVSSKMSVIIPVFLGFFLFKDTVTPVKIAGILLCFPAFYLIFKKEKGEKSNLKYLFLPLLLFIGNGTNDSVLKISEHYYISSDSLDYIRFLSSSFFHSFILGLGILIYGLIKNKNKIALKNILAGIVLGLLNWGSTYCFLRGLELMQTSVFIPVFNVSIVSLSALLGFVLFKEQLRTVNWIGIGLAIASITLVAAF